MTAPNVALLFFNLNPRSLVFFLNIPIQLHDIEYCIHIFYSKTKFSSRISIPFCPDDTFFR